MRWFLLLLPFVVVADDFIEVEEQIGFFPTSDPQWIIVSVTSNGSRQEVQAIHVPPGGFPASRRRQPAPAPTSGAPRVLTVCEALGSRDDFDLAPVVIVGIFKSGLDETLRQDCPSQLVTGDVGWMSAIALTRPTDPPESLRAEIEKKRQIILKSGPPGAHPRPERVVALYGRLVSPSGLTTIPCCTAPVEINAAPARLLGLDERDFRVLR